MSKFSGSLAVAAIAALTVLSPAFAVTYQTVALSGQQAPGLPESVVFGPTHTGHYANSYSAFPARVSLNNAGQVAFKGYLEGGEVVWQDAIAAWMGTPGSLSLIARGQQPTPGLPGEVLTHIEAAHFMVLNDAGELAFTGRSAAPGSDPQTGPRGYFVHTAAGLKLAALVGQPAPGMPEGTLLSGLSQAFPMGTVFGGNGQLAFRAGTTADGAGIWYGSADTLQLVAPEDLPQPAFTRLNNHGQLGAAAGMSTGGNNAIRIGTAGGSWDVVAAAGDPAPGAPEGARFQRLYPPGVNDNGQLAWYATASRAEPQKWSGSGLWVGQPGNVQAIAVTGRQAPSLPAGTVFKDFGTMTYTMHVNAQGKTAFWATVNGPETGDVTSLWIGSADGLTLVARTGQPLPGITQTSWSPEMRASMNAAGQAVFAASSSGHTGIWATDPLGVLGAVVVSGQDWVLPSGERKVVMTCGLIDADGTGGQDGLARPINDAGWVAFTLEFTDRSSGVFIADTNVPGVTAGILLGHNQRGEVVGQAGDVGHVTVTFPTTEAGIFNGYYHPDTPERLFGNPSWAGLDLVPLALAADGRGQFWDLSFTGSFSEDAILDLIYDESLLPAGLDESLLAIYHEVPAGWERLAGTVDPLSNTLTVSTDSFCNFALGIVPEPATAGILGIVAIVALYRRRA